MPQSKGKKRLNIRQIFKTYKYKNQTPERLAKPPASEYYIKKSEIVSDHAFSCTYEEYKEIIEAYSKVVLNHLLRGKKVPLPYRFGYLQIVKTKSDRKAVDWKATNETHGIENLEILEKGGGFKDMKLIQYENSHTDGYSCRLHWMRKDKRLKNRYCYDFVLTRANKHKLRDMLLNNPDLIYRFNDK